jgi:hypothetical protein
MRRRNFIEIFFHLFIQTIWNSNVLYSKKHYFEHGDSKLGCLELKLTFSG